MADAATARATLTPVLNNRESLVQLQMPSRKTEAGVLPGKTVDLQPGMNFPKTADWELVAANPMVQLLMGTKIEPSAAPEQNPERVGHFHLVVGAPVGGDNPLAAMKETDAVAAVAEILDMALAKRILAQETRARVAAALKGHINTIENTREAKKK